jgi:hypothetical protein
LADGLYKFGLFTASKCRQNPACKRLVAVERAIEICLAVMAIANAGPWGLDPTAVD